MVEIPWSKNMMREPLEESKIANTLHMVTGGEQAMAFLRMEGPFLFGPRPDLVLLDAVKLPDPGQ